MREAVQGIYKERKALTASLKDMSRFAPPSSMYSSSVLMVDEFFCTLFWCIYSAVAKLDGVLIGVALICIFFVCLLIFSRANTLASLVPLATIVLGFSFIFGHSAQLMFESVS